jgi:hypothetical protein
MLTKDLNKKLIEKVPEVAKRLIKGKEITMQLTPKGLKVKSADIEII